MSISRTYEAFQAKDKAMMKGGYDTPRPMLKSDFMSLMKAIMASEEEQLTRESGVLGFKPQEVIKWK